MLHSFAFALLLLDALGHQAPAVALSIVVVVVLLLQRESAVLVLVLPPLAILSLIHSFANFNYTSLCFGRMSRGNLDSVTT